MKICVIYLDDIIIFSRSYEDHLQHLDAVFERIKGHGLKLNPSKCTFFQQRLKSLGHIISENGIEVNQDKIKALQTWPVPTNVEELRSFLGFAGYFRKFVKDYSKVAKCLNDLLGRNGPATSRRKRVTTQKATTWKWEQEHQYAFDTLIE